MAQPEPVVGAPGTVVVPLDGSDVAARAVPVGADLAKGFGAELVLVTDHPDPRADRMVRPVWLDEAAASVSGPPVRTEFRDEHPADAAICTVARRSYRLDHLHGDARPRCDRHRDPRQRRAATSSATPNVRSSSSGRTSTAAGSGHGQPMIVCHDGSDASAAIVPVAAAWAKALGTPVVVAHVFHPLDVESAQCSRPRPIDAIVERTGRETGRRRRPRSPRDSYPVGVILELARTLPASLVALSTHGRTGLARATSAASRRRWCTRAPARC